jgi:hypothetical protein
VTVAQLATNPAVWDGKRVTVAGWISNDFEDHNLSSDAPSPCQAGSVVGASGVSALVPYGHTRRGVFSGTFRFIYGRKDGDEIIISTGSAAPGPIEALKVLHWTSSARRTCRSDD